MLPGDCPAVDLEARPLGLDDLERTQIGAEVAHLFGQVVARGRRKRDDPVVFDPDHLHRVQVHDRVEAFDRPGVWVAVGVIPNPARGPREPPALVAVPGERSDAPRLDGDELGIRDTALGEGRAHPLVAANCALARGVLLGRNRRLDVGDELPGEKPAFGQGHETLIRVTRDRVEHDRERLARRGCPVGSDNLVARRLAKADLNEARPVREVGHRAERADGLRELRGGQGVGGMRGARDPRCSIDAILGQRHRSPITRLSPRPTAASPRRRPGFSLGAGARRRAPRSPRD